MKKSLFELMVSLYLLFFVLLLLLLPIYYADAANFSFFVYASRVGATVLSYGGGILLFLLMALAVVKAVLAFLFEKQVERGEQVGFALYSVWIVLGLGFAMVCFSASCMIAFGLGLGLALSGLIAFFLDYKLYGQD
jgi:hypothetical protein